MAATSMFFSGRLIRTPGSYSVIDASGLEQIGLSAAGIVAVLGTAEGGTPMSAITEVQDLVRITKPERARELFRSGQLREVADMLFAPSNDADILGGAVEVIACKVNPATQSTGVLANAYGDALDLTSADYGAFTEQVNVLIGTGTNQGKQITITFEDDVEAGDDIGGDTMFSLKYVDSGDGWTTMSAEVEAAGAIVCKGTRTQLGLDDDARMLAQPAAPSVLSVKSADSGDTGIQVVIYGINAGGTAAVSETIATDASDGTTRAYGTTSFSKVCGCRFIGTAAGVITVEDDDPVSLMTIAAGSDGYTGLAPCQDMYVAKTTLDAIANGATTEDLVVAGLSDTGAAQVEMITLTGAVEVNGVADWSKVQWLAMGTVEAARTITFDAEAGRTVPATTHDTLQKCADYYNAKSRTPVATTYGFVFTLVTGLTSFNPNDLDDTTNGAGAVDCLDPAEPDFYADLWACEDWINNNSQYITAAASTGAAGGAPDNTPAAVFLSGGIEGVTTSQSWLDALNLLKQTRVNSIVVLTHDPSTHADLDAHCAYMGGVGRDERDGFVGLLNSGGTALAGKAEIKSQIVDLNSKYIRAVAQSAERYNTAGEREEFDPFYLAAILAGMQAGCSVGTSLTYKFANVLNLRQGGTGATAWNPTDDSEEMIAAGLCFLESVEGVGRRVVRNITTYLTSANIAFTEASVVEAAGFACKNLRTNLEVAVGKKGFAGTINAAKGVAVNTLGLLIDELVLVAWRSLNIELVVDVLNVEVEIAPVIPINFVATTVHLVTLQQTAA
jgi:hypothetical protein